MFKKFVIIGTGRLAKHWSEFLASKDKEIVQIYGRNLDEAKVLAARIGSSCTNQMELISLNADVYFLCVKDDSIEEVSESLRKFLSADKLILHFSGSLPYEQINSYFINRGVMWPLQSFNEAKVIHWEEIPFFIDANENIMKELKSFASEIGLNYIEADYTNRKMIHLAAVVANNFSNFNLIIAEDILRKIDIPFEVLKPIMTSSIDKIFVNGSESSQTGPARRDDHEIVQAQLNLLEREFPEYKAYYKLMSDLISTHFNHKK
ncbi:MAG: Rossmann-like and DUF2520 domain-containing protein [Saprospiraceae bacterium]